jgi:enamine deaminase RidA (YjgF/YER057c/UK114 family)
MPSERRLITTGSPMETTMAYSRAVVQGDWCMVAGVTGLDYATMTMPEGVEAQARNCFATIGRVLAEAGFAMGDIIRVVYYLSDRGDVAAVAPVIAEALGDVRPAATLVIAGLMRAEMLVEIEVTAFKG